MEKIIKKPVILYGNDSFKDVDWDSVSMRKKILILTPFYPPNIGGAETFTEALVEETRKKYEVDVLTFRPLRGNAPAHKDSIFRMRWLWKPPPVWEGTSIKNFLLVFPKMLWCGVWKCVGEGYSVVHAQGLISALVGVFIKKIFKVRLFVTLLALYDFGKYIGGHIPEPFFNKVCRWIFHNADKVFVEGRGGFFDANFVCADIEKIKEFQHWVDQGIFKPKKTKQNNRVKVLYVGRPIFQKGRYIIEMVEDKLKEEGVKVEFKYVENIAYEKLPKLYQGADILVVPSIYSEGFVRVVAEGSSCGLAILASDKGSLPELVPSIIGGNFPPTIDNFKARIKELANDRRELRKLQKNAAKYAKKVFSVKNAGVIINEY